MKKFILVTFLSLLSNVLFSQNYIPIDSMFIYDVNISILDSCIIEKRGIKIDNKDIHCLNNILKKSKPMKMPITKAGSEKLYGIGNNSDKYIITPNSIHLLEGRIYLFKDKDILKWLNFFYDKYKKRFEERK